MSLLWTDMLFLGLVGAVILIVLAVRRSEALCSTWAQVGKNSAAMAALVILMLYLIVALLDCIRLDPARSSETQSVTVLDQVLVSLRRNTEKSYSAPLAAHSFVKEMRRQGDTVSYMRPRLEFGGAHLQAPEREQWVDIAGRVLGGGIVGLTFWLLIAVALVAVLARRGGRTIGAQAREVAGDRTKYRWRAILLTLGVVLVGLGMLAKLSLGYHVLGTDKVGQDVLYLSIKGVRTGVLIGTLTTLVMLPLALGLGVMAGYFRGWVDDVIQYVYTTLNSIPSVLLIAGAVLVLQVQLDNAGGTTSLAERADLRLLFLCAVLGLTSWTGLCRYLRAESLKLRDMDYVQAARSLNVGHFTILRRHLIPNVMHLVMIAVVLDFSTLVLAEAVLSYVQIGVDPSMPSWGNMINAARLELAREPVVWWSLASAFVFMFGLVLAANVFADAVRDAFDPRTVV